MFETAGLRFRKAIYSLGKISLGGAGGIGGRCGGGGGSIALTMTGGAGGGGGGTLWLFVWAVTKQTLNNSKLKIGIFLFINLI